MCFAFSVNEIAIAKDTISTCLILNAWVFYQCLYISLILALISKWISLIASLAACWANLSIYPFCISRKGLSNTWEILIALLAMWTMLSIRWASNICRASSFLDCISNRICRSIRALEACCWAYSCIFIASSLHTRIWGQGICNCVEQWPLLIIWEVWIFNSQ